jgi:membrane fusion protein, multidrug efflux system
MSVQTRLNLIAMSPLPSFSTPFPCLRRLRADVRGPFFRVRCFRWPMFAVVAVLGLSGCEAPPGAAGPGGGGAAPLPKVAVIQTEPQSYPFFQTLSGRVSAREQAEIRPQVGGLLQAVRFEEGQFVKAGQALYEIDPAPYEAQVAQATAALERARAQRAVRQVNAERATALLPLNAISAQQHDEAHAALAVAKAEVSMAQAALEKARIDLQNTVIRAPIDGYVGRSLITIGALLAAHQKDALAVLTQLDPVYVDLTQSSQERGRWRQAMEEGWLQGPWGEASWPVQLVLEDGQAYAHPGELRASERVIDPQTGTQTLRVQFPNPDHGLLPGMYVRAQVQQGVVPNAILLPHAAVSHDPKGTAFVMVIDAAQTAQLRPVTAQAAADAQWLITHGLAPEEQVVVEGLQRVRPGGRVAIEALISASDNKD